MKVEETKLRGVLLFKPDVFEDFRGEFVENYNERKYNAAIKRHMPNWRGPPIHFVQDTFSVSSKRVLRGFHGDDKTWKLIDCLHGKIYLVIVNCEHRGDMIKSENSAAMFPNPKDNFGKWVSFTLSDKNRHQVLVPPMHGVAHLVLSKDAIFHYKQSTYYDPETLKQFTYKYNEVQFGVWWPDINPILSQRDEVEHEP